MSAIVSAADLRDQVHTFKVRTEDKVKSHLGPLDKGRPLGLLCAYVDGLPSGLVYPAITAAKCEALLSTKNLSRWNSVMSSTKMHQASIEYIVDPTNIVKGFCARITS